VVASPVLTSGGGSPPAPTGLVLEMQTTGAAETITLPITVNVDVTVDWGDGSSPEAFTADSPSHEYADAGTYDVVVTGTSTSFGFNNAGDKLKVLSVSGSGGAYTAVTCQGAFFGCTNLTSADLGGFGDWDANSTGTRDFFYLCSSLTSVTWGSKPISVNSIRAFLGCSSLPSVDMSAADMSNASLLNSFFSGCSAMSGGAGIVSWDVTNITSMSSFMTSANNALSTSEYDAVLVAWEAQAVNNSVPVSFGDATYTTGSAADTARTALANDHLWTITDGGGV
jgi:hypothetical protein